MEIVFFYSVAYGLQKIFHNIPNCLNQYERFQNVINDINELSFLCRQVTVDEIMNNINFYQSFFDINDVFHNVECYREKGTFEGNMGDILISALCNFLRIPICIITARVDTEIILIQSNSMHIVSTPLFVAYNHIGPGHYSAMNECSQTVDLKEDAEPQSSEKRECVQKKCRCGRSKPKMMLQNQKFCSKRRCPCHKNKLACTIDCDFVNCDNPHGYTRDNIVGGRTGGYK